MWNCMAWMKGEVLSCLESRIGFKKYHLSHMWKFWKFSISKPTRDRPWLTLSIVVGWSRDHTTGSSGRPSQTFSKGMRRWGSNNSSQYSRANLVHSERRSSGITVFHRRVQMHQYLPKSLKKTYSISRIYYCQKQTHKIYFCYLWKFYNHL